MSAAHLRLPAILSLGTFSACARTSSGRRPDTGDAQETGAPSREPAEIPDPPHAPDQPPEAVDDDDDGFAELDYACSDANSSVHPTAPAWCNGWDDDRDASVDDGVDELFFEDWDADGYGNPWVSRTEWGHTDGYDSNHDDRNDVDGDQHPGAREPCDRVDQDCDGQIDEGLATFTRYEDWDTGGFGDPNVSRRACSEPRGFVSGLRDCADTNGEVHPGQSDYRSTERGDGGVDYHCDGQEASYAAQAWISESDLPNVNNRKGWWVDVPACGQTSETAEGCDASEIFLYEEINGPG